MHENFLRSNHKKIIRGMTIAVERWSEFAQAMKLTTREAEQIQSDIRVAT